MIALNKAYEISRDEGRHTELSNQHIETAISEIKAAGAAFYYAELDIAYLLCRCMAYTANDLRAIQVEHCESRFEALSFSLVRLPTYLNSIVMDSAVGVAPVAAAVSRYIDFVGADLFDEVQKVRDTFDEKSELKALATAEATLAGKTQVLPAAADLLSMAMVEIDKGLRGPGNSASLSNGLEILGQVAGTLIVGGYEKEGRELKSQLSLLEQIVSNGMEGDEETIRRACSGILDIERRIHIALQVDASDVLLSYHSDPRVLRQLLQQTLAELKEARSALGLCLETGIVSDQFMASVVGLRRVAKALMVAPLGAVQSVLGVLANELDTATDNRAALTEPTFLDDIAILLSGTEMHLEFLNAGLLPPETFLSEAVSAAIRVSGDILIDVVPTKTELPSNEEDEFSPHEFRDECRAIISRIRASLDSTDRCQQQWNEIHGLFAELAAAARIGDFLLCAELCDGVIELNDHFTSHNTELSAVSQLELKALLIKTLDTIQVVVDEDAPQAIPGGTLTTIRNLYEDFLSSLRHEVPHQVEEPAEETIATEETTSEEAELISIFRREFEGIYASVSNAITGLEDAPESALVTDGLVRSIHTMRGISHSVDHPEMACVFETLEEGLNTAKSAGRPLSLDEIQLLKEAMRRAKVLVELIETDAQYEDAADLTESINTCYSGTSAPTDSNQSVSQTDSSDLADYPISFHEHDGLYEEEMLELYLEEAESELPTLEELLLQWESDISNKELLGRIKRTMHTLKGSARMAMATPIGDVTHELEEILAASEVGLVSHDAGLFRLVMTGYDAIRAMTEVAHRGARIAYPRQLMMCLRKAVETNKVNERRLALAIEEALGDAPLAATHCEIQGEETTVSAEVHEAPANGQAEVIEAPQVETVAEEAYLAIEEIGHTEEETTEEISEPSSTETYVEVLQPATVSSQESDFDNAVAQLRERRAQQRNKKRIGGQETPKLKVDSLLIDHLIDSSAEACVEQARLQQFIEAVENNNATLWSCMQRLKQQLDRMEHSALVQAADTTTPGVHDPLRLEQFSTYRSAATEANNLVGEIESVLEHMGERVSNVDVVMRRLEHSSTSLKESLLEARLVTFQTVISRLRTLVRQTATASGKEADFVMYGENTKVDRQLLESLTPAFEHMIRNAVDHGLEAPDDRTSANKSPKGSVVFRVAMIGGLIRIELVDDGAGISVAKVRQKAIEKGLITEDSDLNDDLILQLITKPGFSTASQITQLSGRGVGMDVVRESIEQLGGTLKIISEEGKGTTFVITVPFAQGSNRVIVAKAGSTLFAVPTSVIHRVIYYPREQVEGTDARYVEFASRKFMVVHSSDLLALDQDPQLPSNKLLPALLIENGHQSFAILPDEIVGMQDLHIKPLKLFGQSVAGLIGISDTVEGELVPVVDPKRLFNLNITVFKHRYEVKASHRKAVGEAVKPVALVVDDSMAMRKAESSFLTALGYEVVTATNGVEAIQKLAEIKRPDVMIVDVEMPKLDGFGLTRYVREHKQHQAIPIIMITSRSGEQHRQHAMDLGVNVFLGKPFNQTALRQALANVVNARVN